MSDEQRPLLCPNGVELAVAASCLTKYLRVGLEADALWWAQQIEVRFPHYVWRRLEIFACEDVGLARPEAIAIVRAAHSAYSEHLERSRAHRPDANLLSFAVVFLARSPKNREADDLKSAVDHMRRQGWGSPVPDVALDLHTTEGRARRPELRDQIAHWLTEASRVVPRVGPRDWRVWIRRYWAQRGAVPLPDVLDEAHDADSRCELIWGGGGYPGAEIEDDNEKEA